VRARSRFTKVVYIHAAVIDYYNSVNGECELPQEDHPKIIQTIIFKRQYLLYLDALHQQAEESSKFLDQIYQRYTTALEELKVVCKAKSAVPVDQVYVIIYLTKPLFIQLSKIWFSCFDELFLLSFRRGLLDTLVSHCRVLHFNLATWSTNF
jgi:hypothetical protein